MYRFFNATILRVFVHLKSKVRWLTYMTSQKTQLLTPLQSNSVSGDVVLFEFFVHFFWHRGQQNTHVTITIIIKILPTTIPAISPRDKPLSPLSSTT